MYTLQEKTRPTRYMLSTLGPHMALNHTYLTWSAYSNLSRVVNRVGRMHYSREKVLPTLPQPSWVAHGTHLSFYPNTTIEAVRLNQVPVDGRLLGLLGPYHQHAIGTFNTCSRGPTRRSLTDIGGGYNLGGAGLPHHTPQPSQLTVLRFPPKGPVRSQVINPIITNWIRDGTNCKSHEWEPPFYFYHNLSSKQSMS
jgi:hypothetical protein